MSEPLVLSPPVVNDDFAAYHGDCIEVIKSFPDDSVHLTVSSPPFPSMYVYNNTPRDIGNTTGIGEMLGHFGYLVEELLRVTMPGRTCCIHLTNVPAFKHHDGYVGRFDFRGDVIRLFESKGWIYASEVLCDKDPQVRAQRTKDRGLLFKSLAGDSSVMAPVMGDYILILRKPGDNKIAIPAGRSEKYGNPDGWISQDEWIEWAAAVWYRRVRGSSDGLSPCSECDDDEDIVEVDAGTLTDSGGRRYAMENHPSRFQVTPGIKETNVLNVRVARDEKDERHLCPLQLDVIERCIKLWSAPGEIVLDPFGGIGSTVYQAIKLRRKGIFSELKQSYFDQAVRNCQTARQTRHGQRTIFDAIRESEEAEAAGVEA